MPCDDKRWHTQQQCPFYPCVLQSLNSCSESLVLTTSFSPFQYLVSLQIHETHLVKQVTSVRKSLRITEILDFMVDWAQEKEESSCNTLAEVHPHS